MTSSTRIWWLLAVAACWEVPLVAHQLGIDLLVLVVLAGAITSLLTVPGGLDRTAVGLLLTTAYVMAAGALFSIWPFGLSPVAMGVALLSGVVASAALSGRRPAWPGRWQASDGVIVGSGILATVLAYWPLAGLSIVERLGYTTTRLDRSVHFAIFDAVHEAGGYPFLNQEAGARSIHGGYEVAYPQGAHFLLAIVDVFLRGTDDPGAAVAEYNRYVLGIVIGFGCFVAAIVWAARWIAGMRVTEPARVVVAAVVAAIALFGPLGSYLYTCFDAEMVGLTFIALATAIAVRPLPHDGEHLLAATAATFATFQAYNLLGVLPAAALGASLLVHRFPFHEHRRLVALIVVPAGVLAVLPTVLSVTSGFDANRQALIVNTHTPIAAAVVIGLAVVATLPLATRRGREDGVWKGFAVVAAVTVVIVLGFGAYQLASIGTTTYYFGKFVFAAYVIAIIGLGNLARCLPRQGSPWRLAVLATVVVLVGITAPLQQRLTPKRAGELNPEVPIAAWARGERRASLGPFAISLADDGVLGDAVPTLVVYRPEATHNAALSWLLASFNGDLGSMAPALQSMTKPEGERISRQTPESVVAALAQVPFPVRVLVKDEVFATELQALLEQHPELEATVELRPSIGA